MAVAVDSEMPSNAGVGTGLGGGGSITSPQTFSFTNTAGTVLYLIVGLGNDGTSTAFGTVTYNGVTMTKLLDQTSPDGKSRVGLFRLLSPATGANTVSVAFTITSPSNSEFWAGATSFTGNDPTTPETQSTSSNGSGTSGTASLSGVASMTLAGCGAGTSMSAQTQTLSWAKNVDNSTQNGNGRASRTAATGAVTHSFTIGASDSWSSVIVEIAPAAAVAAAGASYVPVKIPNNRVGPMALRRNYRGRRTWTQTSSGAQTILQTLSAVTTDTASIVKQVAKTVQANDLTNTASIVKQVGKFLSATTTNTASILAQKAHLLELDAVTTSTASIIKQVNKILSATTTDTASIVKQVGKILSATTTDTATLIAQKAHLLAMSVTTTNTASMVKQVGTHLSVTTTNTASLIKQVGKTLSVSTTDTATLATQRIRNVTLAVTTTSTATIRKAVNKTITVTTTNTPSLVKQIPRAMSAVTTNTASLVAQFLAAGTAFSVGIFDRTKPGQTGFKGIFTKMGLFKGSLGQNKFDPGDPD